MEKKKDLEGITEQQYDEIKAAFDSFDLDGSQSIEFKQLRDLMNEFGIKLSNEELNDIMAEVDANGDGSIDFDEFLQLMKDKLKNNGPPQDDLESAFKLLDCGNTGYIQEAELVNICTLLSMKFSDYEIHEMINKASNGTGRVYFKEFCSMVLN